MGKCLITGCNGFIGSHLSSFLANSGMIVYGTFHNNDQRLSNLNGNVTTLKCEITNKGQVQDIVSQVKPDLVFHLAGHSRVKQSWTNPEETFKTNTAGTIYLLDALREQMNDPLVVVVCSAAEYGYRGKNDLPITEKSKFQPSDPYSVSKVAQDLIANMYWQNYGLRAIRVRPFNITGPGMTGDACSDFAKGISKIERGLQPSIQVGDLDPVRDVTDIKDALTALWRIAERGRPGQAYNICSGVGHRIEDILYKLISLSNVKINVIRQQDKSRKCKYNIQVGSNRKLQTLGWKSTVALDETLLSVINYWRKIDF